MSWGGANRPKTSTKIGRPINNDGVDGDIQIKGTALGAKLFAKWSGRWWDIPLSINGITKIGTTDSDYLSIDRNSVDIFTNGVKVASFGETTTVKDINLTGRIDNDDGVGENVIIGKDNPVASSNTNGTHFAENIIIGKFAATTVKTTSGQTFNRNVCIGHNVMRDTDPDTHNDVADENVAIGHGALLFHMHGDHNVAIGKGALKGINNTSTGEDNIGVGKFSGSNITTGAGNVAIGYVDFPSATGDNQLVISSGGSGGVTWIAGDSSGKVGIGTLAPAKHFHAVGGMHTKGRGTYAITITANGGTEGIDPSVSTTTTGVGTSFVTDLVPGDKLTVSGETRTVTAIASNTELTVDANWSDNANDATPDCIPAIFTAQDSSGNTDFVIQEDGNVGIGTTSPATALHLGDDSAQLTFGSIQSSAYYYIKRDNTNKRMVFNTPYSAQDDGGFLFTVDDSSYKQNFEFMASGDSIFKIRSWGDGGNSDLVFGDQDGVKFTVIDNGNVGIETTAPGQLLDVNSGGGNMIADGYDTHSLAVYKENIEDASGYLDKVLACPAQKWNRKPFISANEIKEAVFEEFGEDVLIEEWNELFPEDNSHRQKALYNMPDGDLKTWIDDWCEAKRVEMRSEDKWQKKRLGLVADAELTAEHLPEVVSINDEGEPTGIDTMTYIGILHNAVQELSAKVDTMQTEINNLKEG